MDLAYSVTMPAMATCRRDACVQGCMDEYGGSGSGGQAGVEYSAWSVEGTVDSEAKAARRSCIGVADLCPVHHVAFRGKKAEYLL